ncbi:TrbC/VirB2 family protein [Succinivibrio sp.]|uniref:TrbC/VirB2 family protein n=1 Tax=Succinivibrio sp. TaxID=2053619 RepID=UPI003865E032
MKRTLIAFSLTLLFLLFLNDANASEVSSTALPYESYLKDIQLSLTGPVARSVALIGIVSSGMTLIFAGGEISRFVKSLVYLVLVVGMILGANSIMTGVFNGACIDDGVSVNNSTDYKKENLHKDKNQISTKNSDIAFYIDYSKASIDKYSRMC